MVSLIMEAARALHSHHHPSVRGKTHSDAGTVQELRQRPCNLHYTVLQGESSLLRQDNPATRGKVAGLFVELRVLGNWEYCHL